MSSLSQRIAAAGIALVAAAALTGCGGGSDSGGAASGTGAGSAPAGEAAVELVSPDKLTVCTHLSFKPFEYRDESNNVVGLDIDYMDLVAEQLGVTVEIVDIDFASMQSGAVFQSKKCDIVAGAVTITEKRAEAIAFSEPYFEATQALLTKTDSGITDLSSMQGKKLAVQTDTTGQIYAEENAAEYGYEIVVFDDSQTTLNSLISGRADAAINDNGVVYGFAAEFPETAVVAEFNTGEVYGFAVQKDNENASKLLEITDKVITDAKDDGTAAEIYERWMGASLPSASPSP